MAKITRRQTLELLKYLAVSAPLGSALVGCGVEGEAEGSPEPNLGLRRLEITPDLEGDERLDWWMRGNYGPLDTEGFYEDLEVIGSLPPELSGTFLRNGSNPKGESPQHWFFGDGMIHGIHFERGKVKWYRNAWIQTPALHGDESGISAGRANTALVYHQEKLLALYEVSAPFELNPQDLSSVGYHDYQGALEVPMCAHPKIDPLTGEMWFIGVGLIPPSLNVAMVNAQGELKKLESLPLDTMIFMHDFQLTERFVVIFDLPMCVSPEILTGGEVFDWRPERGARIGLLPRDGSFEQVRWFEVEPSYAFHSFNAYEEGDEVVIELCRVQPELGTDFFTGQVMPSPWRWRLNLETGRASEEQLEALFTEFPMIDRRLQGQTHRYNYGLTLVESSERYPMHPNGLFKQDRQTGELLRWELGEAVQLDEAVFVPASPESGEDEGWLLSVAYNRLRAKSEVLVFNAQAPQKGPIARVLLPERVPFGFHGLWLPQEV